LFMISTIVRVVALLVLHAIFHALVAFHANGLFEIRFPQPAVTGFIPHFGKNGITKIINNIPTVIDYGLGDISLVMNSPKEEIMAVLYCS